MMQDKMSYVFSSPLLTEVTNQIMRLKMKSSAQRWASGIQNKYAVALFDHPCADLTAEEYDQAYSYIDDIKQNHGLDLLETFPKPDRSSFLAAANEVLATVPVEPQQEPSIEDGPRREVQRWENFLLAYGGNVSFEDWLAISSAFRRTLDRKQLVEPSARGSMKSYLNSLPKQWHQKLNLILPTTELSEVVTTYQGTDITRGDIATVVPTDAVKGPSPTGWLNDKVVEIFLKIIAAARNQESSTVVVNSYVVKDLKATNIKTSAKKAGIEAATITTIDTILFPLHVESHWQLVAAFPKTRSLIIYDSLRTGQEKHLKTVHDWLKEAIGEPENVRWDLQEGICPHQPENSLCGIFMCMNAMAVMFGKTPLEWYFAEDGAKLRQYVAHVICKGSFPYPT